MKKTVCASVLLGFLLSVLPGPVFGLDPVVVSPQADKDPVYPPGYGYVAAKSKEEIALELFTRAIGLVPELKLQQNYDQYLEAYRKALQAVYSAGR
ncbi:MAG TPA: hypothetical protein VLS90_11280, partial [Thermodesulfobacteriota bacterium]|nr:hypothetical protein [Thermodesulfobacteriota bacterium]